MFSFSVFFLPAYQSGKFDSFNLKLTDSYFGHVQSIDEPKTNAFLFMLECLIFSIAFDFLGVVISL